MMHKNTIYSKSIELNIAMLWW